MPVNAVIIACRTTEREVLAAMTRTGVDYPIRWIESGLHNVPKLLHKRLQEELDACAGFDTVLLAMAFCGNSVVGLKTHDFQLVLPRCDDCITLLLGCPERRQQEGYTFFLTEGWLKGERNIWTEYESCIERYGEKRGKRIFDSLFAHYKYIALVETGAYDTEKAEREAKQIAARLGLQYRRIPGGVEYLQGLLTGPWPEERFVRIPPQREVTSGDCTLKGAHG